MSLTVVQRTRGARKFSPSRRHSGQPGASFPISRVDGAAEVFESTPPAKTAKTDLGDYHLRPMVRSAGPAIQLGTRSGVPRKAATHAWIIPHGLALFRTFRLLTLAGFFQCDCNRLFLRFARPHFRLDVRTDRFVRGAFLERHVLLHSEGVLIPR